MFLEIRLRMMSKFGDGLRVGHLSSLPAGTFLRKLTTLFVVVNRGTSKNPPPHNLLTKFRSCNKERSELTLSSILISTSVAENGGKSEETGETSRPSYRFYSRCIIALFTFATTPDGAPTLRAKGCLTWLPPNQHRKSTQKNYFRFYAHFARQIFSPLHCSALRT